jgi:hypothetical protein
MMTRRVDYVDFFFGAEAFFFAGLHVPPFAIGAVIGDS